jgi:hypothetical protein
MKGNSFFYELFRYNTPSKKKRSVSVKKRVVMFLALASIAIIIFAQGPNPLTQAVKRAALAITPTEAGWTAPVNVSNTGTRSQMPFGAVDGQGIAYVVWTEFPGDSDIGDRDIAFTTNRTGSWEAASRVTPIAYTAIDDVGFPDIAVTAEGLLHFAYHDGNFAAGVMTIFYRPYSNGTWRPWEDLTVPGGSCSYVSLAVSPTDNYLYAVNMMDKEVQFDLVLRWRNPATGAWTGDILPMTPTAKYMPDIFIDSAGTAHLVYISRFLGDSSVWYAKSTTPRNINSWTAPVQLAAGTGFNWNNPRVVADDNGDAYVVWQDRGSGNGEILLRKTVSGVWQAAQNISQTSDLSETAQIAVNPETKEMYVAWQENVGGTNWEVYMKQYEEETPGGQKKWSDIINFSNTSLHSGEPSLVMQSNGDVHFFFMDTPGSNREVMYSYKQKEIEIPPSVTVTSPNGGESWQANSTHDITWTSQGTVGDVRIELSTDGGITYSDIASSTPNDGSYSWPIPYLSPTGSNCFVRISEASDGTPSDTSDSPFTVAPPPKPKAPLNPALDTRLDTTETKKTNKLTWQANSENAAIPLKNYRVYRKRSGQADSAFALLASVSPATLQYEDSNLEILQKYVYRLTTLATNNDESDPSTSVAETKKFEFPPLNPAVQTAMNRILFYQEKHVTVTFEKNTLNDEAEVSGYELYRRKAGESESEFTVIATLSSSTLSYKYIIKPPESLTQKYDYALKTTFADGRKSRFSAVATEQ